MQGIWVVDTNVVVSGLIAAGSSSPPARILSAMVDGSLVYLMSPELLDEYANVLGRPAVVRAHGLTSDTIDRLLTELVANSIWREPDAATSAPDPEDNHLWALLASEPKAQLVTGDRLLLEKPPGDNSVVSPRGLVDAFFLQ